MRPGGYLYHQEQYRHQEEEMPSNTWEGDIMPFRTSAAPKSIFQHELERDEYCFSNVSVALGFRALPHEIPIAAYSS